MGKLTDPAKALENKSERERVLLASAGSLPSAGSLSSLSSRVHEARVSATAGAEIGRRGGKWMLPPSHWMSGKLEATTFLYGAKVPDPKSPAQVAEAEAAFAAGRDRILPEEYSTLAPTEVAAAFADSLPQVGRRIGFRTRSTKNPIG